MTPRLFTLMAVGSSLLLAACVAAPAPVTSAQNTDVTIVADDLVFAPERLEIPAGESVQLHLRNDGSIVHDLVFEDGWESGLVLPGEAVTVELGPQAASSVAWCSVPGHRDAGMELEVIVREGGDA
ncbi:MAG: cupredoxin domain-containing protein [Nitriliruptoraceae bacterium]